MTETPTQEPLVRGAEIARKYGVDPKTVARWAKQGSIPHVTTPGGHRRYRLSEVDAAIEQR